MAVTSIKWTQLLVITLILFVVNAGMAAGGMIATYPTEEHREVNQKIMSDANLSMNYDDDALTTYYNSPEYRAAQNSPEAKYSSTVNLLLVFTYPIYIILVIAAYLYIRKKGVAQQAVIATTIATTLAGLLALIFQLVIAKYLTGVGGTPPNSNAFVYLTLIPAYLYSYLFVAAACWATAALTEYFYNKKFSQQAQPTDQPR